MIRLRTAIQAGLKHPVLGPLVLVLLGLLLAFVVLHAVEDGIAGQLFACVFAAATMVGLARLPLALARFSPSTNGAGRAPPAPFFGSVIASSPPTALLDTPLRR